LSEEVLAAKVNDCVNVVKNVGRELSAFWVPLPLVRTSRLSSNKSNNCMARCFKKGYQCRADKSGGAAYKNGSFWCSGKPRMERHIRGQQGVAKTEQPGELRANEGLRKTPTQGESVADFISHNARGLV
jgi:hypothetical protein